MKERWTGYESEDLKNIAAEWILEEENSRN